MVTRRPILCRCPGANLRGVRLGFAVERSHAAEDPEADRAEAAAWKV